MGPDNLRDAVGVYPQGQARAPCVCECRIQADIQEGEIKTADELIRTLLPTLTMYGSRIDGNEKWATSLKSQSILKEMLLYAREGKQQDSCDHCGRTGKAASLRTLCGQCRVKAK